MTNVSWGNYLFGFSGRINRAKWWLAILIMIILQIVLIGLTMAVQSDTFNTVTGWAYFIISLWVSLAAGTKRLHDLNRSGAWLMLFVGGPMLLLVASLGFTAVSLGGEALSTDALDMSQIARLGGYALIVFGIWFGIAIWAFIWLGCLRGTPGPNNYGPDPLQPGVSEPMRV